jgi:hypothetical protein
MKQFEQCRIIRMVSRTMVFTARRFLIFAALQFVVITCYYASFCRAKNKNQRTSNLIQLSFRSSILSHKLNVGFDQSAFFVLRNRNG